ncbi:hypothetical protein V6M93_01720 [Pectobacterium brasiliense]
MELMPDRRGEKRTRWQRVKMWLVSALEARANRYYLPPANTRTDNAP